MNLRKKVIHDFFSGNFCRAGLVCSLFLLIAFDCLGQAPIINYSSPQVYTVNTPMPLLTPTNTGGAIPAYAYGEVTTVAGTGLPGNINATGTTASFNYPQSLTNDAAGNLYSTDFNNKVIRKIAPGGAVTTFAGVMNMPGNLDGPAASANFTGPTSIVFDSQGNMFVADYTGQTIRKISAGGTVSTFAGSFAIAGFANGTGNNARFNGPYGLAIDAADNLYVAETQNHAIRKITPLGVVTTLAGGGPGSNGTADGTGTGAQFTGPTNLVVDALGNVIVSDAGNNEIRKITPGGVVTTISATNGQAPAGIRIGKDGNFYIAVLSKQQIIKMTPNGTSTVIAGSGIGGAANGFGTAATFKRPEDVNFDAEGNLYIADQDNNLIRKLSLTGYTIDKPLPTGLTFDATTGKISGTPTAASPAAVYTITGYNATGSSTTTVNITVNATNVVPPKTLFPPDISYTTPNVYNVNTAITPLSPTNNGGAVPANVYGQVSNFPVNPVGFNTPTSLAFDAAGNLYVAEFGKKVISKITPAGVVTTFAGLANISSNIDGSVATATFGAPSGIVFDSQGNMFVADNTNNTIRKITASTGIVSTFAGSGSAGLVDATGTAAQFKQPYGLAIDAADNIYVADQGNNAIRKISPLGIVTTLAGTGGSGTQNGPANTATFRAPMYVAVNSQGTVYVNDSINGVVRVITNGMVNTLPGINITASGAPYGMRFDAADNLYFAAKNQIFKLAPNGILISLAGNPAGGAGTANGIGPAVSFSGPVDIAIDNAGDIYIADKANNRLRKLAMTGYSINKALPPGLTFDATTGIISGTPTVPFEITNYIITAYNASGSSNITVSIQVDGLPPPPKILPPQISYTSPQTLSPGANVTILPTNSGGAVPATIYGTTSDMAGGFNRPTAVATDPFGNIYVTLSNGNQIKKIDPATGVVTTVAGTGATGQTNGPAFASNFSSPLGIAVDAFGNIYVADQLNNSIRKITPAGTVSTFAGSITSASGKLDGIGTSATFNAPRGITIDASDNLYVADWGNNLIREINTQTGQVSTIYDAGPLNGPSGVGIDASGNLYIADAGNNAIKKVSNGGVTTIPIPAGTLKSPRDVKIDGTGNIYVTDQGNNRVVRITPDNVVTTIATFTPTQTVVGAALDGLGNLYIGDNEYKVIKIVVSGYEIDKALPAGLIFDKKTGIISGTPTAPSAMQTYIITAYNGGGSSTFKLNLEVANTSASIITFNTPALKTNANNTVTVAVTSNNNEAPILFTSSNPSVISIDANNVLHRVGPGTVTITASQVATAHYTAGTKTYTETFKLSQQIVFPAIAAKSICSADFSSGATSATSASFPITYTSSNTAAATINSNGLIHIVGIGTTTITVSEAGDASTYDDAVPQSQTLTVTAGIIPIVSIAPGATTTCAGMSVIFTANVSNLSALINPGYQWQVNGINIGPNSNTYTLSSATSTDNIKCTVTNNDACPATGFGNYTGLTITPMSALNVTIKSSATGAVCSGDSVTFKATLSQPGADVIYQWKLNGNNVGINSATYTDSSFVNGDVVSCTFTNKSTPCLTTNTGNSNSLTVSITSPTGPAPSITINPSTNDVYESTSITFTAATLNTTGTITYQWQVNGNNAGTNSAVFTSAAFLNGDKVTCTILSGGCAAPATSAPVTLVIKPPLKIIPSNAFTPNGDGINDLWTITGLLSYPSCLVNIYSRNGELVYQSRGYAKPWDGIYKGSSLPVGTYYYIIDLNNNNKPKVSGYIAIIR